MRDLRDHRYTGERDDDVYRRLDGRLSSVERKIPEHLDLYAQTRVLTLLRSQDIISELVKNGEGTRISSSQTTEMFNGMVDAAPVANEHVPANPRVETQIVARQANAASTMSDEVISQNLKELEGQFDISGGLDGAMSAEETRRYFEELQRA